MGLWDNAISTKVCVCLGAVSLSLPLVCTCGHAPLPSVSPNSLLQQGGKLSQKHQFHFLR